MKIITTIISIIGFQCIALCQVTPASVTTLTTSPAVCSLVYSETSAALELSEPGALKCREINILSIPPVTQTVTTLNLEFGMTGAFTFKKDSNLQPYENVDVYIEDMLTGKVFNLKTSDSYSFNVTRKLPGRFVLHMDKMLDRYALSTK